MYYFRYRALNVHGWGQFSPISFVLLANRPDTLAGATTTNVGTDVEITWEVTPFDRWSPVFEYRIKIMRFDGIYIEHPSCDGKDATIIAELKCTVTMLSLLSAEFGLVEGDNIYATVEAMNSIDYSYPSPQSGDALA